MSTYLCQPDCQTSMTIGGWDLRRGSRWCPVGGLMWGAGHLFFCWDICRILNMYGPYRCFYFHRFSRIFPHIFVWCSCFWLSTPVRTASSSSSCLPPPPSAHPHTHNFLTHNLHTHNLLTHNLLTHNSFTHTHTTYSHTQLAHTHTHNLLTHNYSHTITHTHTHNLLTNTQLAHTQLVVHTQLPQPVPILWLQRIHR